MQLIDYGWFKAERIKRTAISGQKNAEWFTTLFSHFQEQLEKHYAATRSVKDYAGMLKISPKHHLQIHFRFNGQTMYRQLHGSGNEEGPGNVDWIGTGNFL